VWHRGDEKVKEAIMSEENGQENNFHN